MRVFDRLIDTSFSSPIRVPVRRRAAQPARECVGIALEGLEPASEVVSGNEVGEVLPEEAGAKQKSDLARSNEAATLPRNASSIAQ